MSRPAAGTSQPLPPLSCALNESELTSQPPWPPSTVMPPPESSCRLLRATALVFGLATCSATSALPLGYTRLDGVAGENVSACAEPTEEAAFPLPLVAHQAKAVAVTAKT